jgi:hypothetical protein
MKKIILSFSFLISINLVISQTTDKGNPASWEVQNKAQVVKIEMPIINIQKIIAEDHVEDLNKSTPYRVGVPHNVNYNFNNSGTWSILPNGDRFWRINISSKNALHLSVNFNSFYLPEGATLHLYNNDKTDLQGAYTIKNNNLAEMLGSWFVKGDNIWIEYFEPKEVFNQGRFNINKIFHGYRLANKHQIDSDLAYLKINESGSCNHDVNCSVGVDFNSKKDNLKHSVAFINLGGFICTGALVNNTSNNKTPYFLTANHCLGSTNPAVYAMRFNWISPNNLSCGTNSNSVQGPTNQIMNGSVLRSRSASSDFMLLQLNSSVNPTWDIEYAGWDRTDNNPTYEVGIHHPSGDIMKVCRDNSGATKAVSGTTDVWLIGGVSAGTGNGWEIGVTEGGSSGSPLFNQNGHIIGQLFGGQAACIGINDNNEFDIYGRFATSWTGNSTNSTRLSNWLDPTNTGVTTLESLDNVAAINDLELEENILIYPNPTIGNLIIDLGNLSGNFNYKVINLLGQELIFGEIKNNLNEINLNSLNSNIYFIKIIDSQNQRSIIKKIILK